MADFRKLDVWKKAHATAIATYKVAVRIRGRDHVSLRSQIIRASQSVPANIVEGRGEASDKEFRRFLKMSLRSANELEYHLLFGNEIGVIAHRDFQSLLDQVIDVKKMLTRLIDRLGNSPI